MEIYTFKLRRMRTSCSPLPLKIIVQVIVGSDTMEMIKEMELMGLSDSDFETEDDESAGEDDSDVDGDEGEDDVEVSLLPFHLLD
ncbi:hypothetical protein Bca4012_020885 [Brassica carinata]